jgi:hypothetical protein
MHTHRTHRPDDEREIFPRHPHRCEAQYSLVADDGVHWYGQLAGLREGRAGPEATSRLKRGKGRIGRIFATRIRQTTDHMNVKISHIRCQSRNFAGDGETASPPLRFAPVGITIHWKATSLLTPSPPPLPGAPHPDFLCSFVGSLNFMRLSLKRAAHAVLSRDAYRKFGASRSFFARCGIPRASPSNLFRYPRLDRVPHVRTSVCGPKTIGEALRSFSFFYCTSCA